MNNLRIPFILLSLFTFCQLVGQVNQDSLAEFNFAKKELDAGVWKSNLGMHEEAIPHFVAAKEVYTRYWGEDHWFVGYCWGRIAIDEFGLARYEEAKLHNQMALERYLPIAEKKPVHTANYLFNLASICKTLDQEEEGFSYLLRAEKMYREFGSPVDWIDTDHLLAMYYARYLFDQEQARAYISRAIRALEKMPDRVDPRLAGFHLTAASIELMSMNTLTARMHYNNARSLVSTGSTTAEIKALVTLMGTILSIAEDSSVDTYQGIQHTLEVISEELPDNHYLIGNARQIFSNTLLALDVNDLTIALAKSPDDGVRGLLKQINPKLKEILEAYQAEDYFKVIDLSDSILSKEVLDFERDHSLFILRFYAALRSFQLEKAREVLLIIESRTPALHSGTGAATEFARTLLQIEYHLAVYGFSNEELQLDMASVEAHKGVRSLSNLADQVLDNSSFAESIIGHHAYRILLDLEFLRYANLAESSAVDRSIELLERVRNNDLLETARKRRIFVEHEGPAADLITRERALRGEIALAKKMLVDLPYSRSDLDPTEIAASITLDSLQALQRQISEAIHLMLPEFGRGSEAPLSSNIVDQLSPAIGDKTLLMYFVNNDVNYLIKVQGGQGSMHKIETDVYISSLIDSLNRGLVGRYDPDPVKRLDELSSNSLYTDSAVELYRLLLGPAQLAGQEELIIIPDGPLHLLPFDALLKSAPRRVGAWKSYDFAAKEHVISYAHSVRSLLGDLDDQVETYPAKGVLALAPFSNGDRGETGTRRGWEPLPHSGREVASVVARFGGMSLYNEAANVDSLKALRGKYPILHFSTHGLANDADGSQSFIALASNGPVDQYENLTAGDLTAFDTPAKMVVLSACETARGRLRRGEGIEGLTRAFLIAGAESVFATLWSVDDGSTAEVIIDFYDGLAQGKSKAEALTQAKRRYLQSAGDPESLHPFFWAGLVGYGNMSAF